MEFSGWPVPVVRSAGRAFVAELGPAGEREHAIGGELGLEVRGLPKQARKPLHRLLTVDVSDPRLRIRNAPCRLIPIVYGFVYDGCAMKYSVGKKGISIVEWRGEPMDGWPYADYPLHLPRVPCRLVRESRLDDQEAFDRIFWQGGVPPGQDDFVVMIPPNEEYGVSLWGEDGDAEEVHVVATVDTTNWVVNIGNECT